MVTAAQAVKSAFDDARGHIKRTEEQKTWNSEALYYWTVYLSALETVAFRSRESALAVEISEYRTQLYTIKS